MSFSIRNTSYQVPSTNYSSSESSSESNPKIKETFEEKIFNPVIESVLKFDNKINSWVWREMNDTNNNCSRGPSGSLVNIQNNEVVNISNNIDIKSTVSDNIQSKKVEMSNNRKNKKRQQKKK